MRWFLASPSLVMRMRELTPAASRLDLASGFKRCLLSWGREGGSFSGFGRCFGALASWRKELPRPGEGPLLGQKSTVEMLWEEFFSDPSQWWDNRSEKGSSRYPDFKHKKTHKGLWLDGKSKPSWVEAELAAMPPGTVQLNIFSCNKMLARYVKGGQYEKTMELFHQMQQGGINADTFTFVPVLNACASLRALGHGRSIHKLIAQSGYESDIHVGTCLVDMYAKCGSTEDAFSVFNHMPSRDICTWNAMMLGYLKCGQGQKALEVYRLMQHEGVEPTSTTFVVALNSCASVVALEEGRVVHDQIIQSPCRSDVLVQNSLVDMYAKCGSIDDAWRVFNEMATRDVVGWSAMIMGFVKCGQGQKALELYQQMQNDGVEPNPITFVGVLNASASLGVLVEGRRVHEQIVQRGFESDIYVGSSLVDMYAKCESIEDAWRVFKKMPTRNVVAWSAMILGYVKCGEGQKALDLYRQMQREGVEPNTVTFVGLLNACASIGALEEGRVAHEQIIKMGYESDGFVGSSLVDMYAKCGSIEDAWRVFNKMPTRNVVAWSAMILGLVKCSRGQKALELYREMQHEGVEPNTVTFVGALNACASVVAIEEGREIHEQIIQRGYEADVYVGSSLIDMYAKCANIEEARSVFDNMPVRDVVAWSAMILGYVKCGEGQRGLDLYRWMQQEGVVPVPVTLAGVLNACGSIAALEDGRGVHQLIIQSGWESDAFLMRCLVDMYAKCGSIEDAWDVFNNMPTRDVVAWTVMILGCVKCGQWLKALELFRQMQLEDVEPNRVTFLAVLNACASLAALEEGRRVHEQIIQTGCEADAFVSSSLIDMYGKCGGVEDAYRVFEKMPTRDVVAWTAMLGAYAIHGHVKEALGHFDQICQEDLEMNGVTFVCLLSACRHGALVDEGLHYFESMSKNYGVSKTVEHYACMVDLLGRAGRLHESEDLIKMMSCEPDGTVWLSLLSACRGHGNVQMGECISEQVLKQDPDNVSSYVLLSNIYASTGKWDSRAVVQRQRLELV